MGLSSHIPPRFPGCREERVPTAFGLLGWKYWHAAGPVIQDLIGMSEKGGLLFAKMGADFCKMMK
jgi:hypothetical protein